MLYIIMNDIYIIFIGFTSLSFDGKPSKVIVVFPEKRRRSFSGNTAIRNTLCQTFTHKYDNSNAREQ